MTPIFQALDGAAATPKQLEGLMLNVLVAAAPELSVTVAVTSQLEAAAAGGVQTTWLEPAVLVGVPRVPSLAAQLNVIGRPCGSVALIVMLTVSVAPTLCVD
jgi:hypothetical protein